MRHISLLTPKHISIMFDMLDTNGSGQIEFEEFYLLICILVAQKVWHAATILNFQKSARMFVCGLVKDGQMKQFIHQHSRKIFDILDNNGDNGISTEEFAKCAFVLNFHGSAVKQTFQEFDVSKDDAMNPANFKLCEKYLPPSYVKQGSEARRVLENRIKHLLEQGKWPEEGWEDQEIEMLLSELSLMDSNNFPGNCGVGEREARVASRLVTARHYRFGHGIGRSGNIADIQPKAAGSSVMMSLTNSMVTDAIRQLGVPSTASAFVVPTATGMTLMLCLLTFKFQRPNARYVLWPRIDQKSCFKSMVTAGLTPIVIENCLEGDELRTDVNALKEAIELHGAESIVCVMTTTSCFAPRVPDRIEEVALLCKQFNIPHLVNNAYGLQSTKCMHLIQQANRVGRVDAFVQSTDKNFLVPVGGSVIAGFDTKLVDLIGKMYPGRASGSPTMDLFITLLSLGRAGYLKLVAERKSVFQYLREQLGIWAHRHNERLLSTTHNPISLAMSLDSLPSDETTDLGSKLFIRSVSGVRVVARNTKQEVTGYHFNGYGAHHSDYPSSYLTAAAALGISKEDVDNFIRKLDKIFKKKFVSQLENNPESQLTGIIKQESECNLHVQSISL